MANPNDSSTQNTLPEKTTIRRLTMGRHSYPPLKRQDNKRTVPWLKMHGQWLADAGFAVGSRVRVEVKAGCVMLTPE